MIRSFASSDTRLLFETGRSKELPPDILRRALRKLELIDNAMTLLDLRLPGKQAARARGQPCRSACRLHQRPMARLLSLR